MTIVDQPSQEVTVPAPANLPTLTGYRALSVEGSSLREVLADNGGGRGMSSFDLSRLKIPSGGATTWAVPTLDGEEDAKEVEGVIIYWRDPQAFWRGKYGSAAAAPPDCSSEDGVMGHGDPGGECYTCPMFQWGSKVSDDGKPVKGKACKSTRATFLLRPGSLLPLFINLPPMSAAASRKYFLGLSNEGLPYYGVTTRLTLEKAKNGTGLDYSRVVMKLGKKLTSDEIQTIRAYRAAVEPVLRTIQPTLQDYQDAEGN